MRRFFVTLALIATVLAPLGARGDDSQIAEQIVQKLKARKASGELKGFNIDLQVEEGSVWLKGHVASTEQEQIALQVAHAEQGVKQVYNELQIQQAATAAKSAVSTEPQIQLASAQEAAHGPQSESKRIAQELVTKLRAQQEAGKLQRFGIDMGVDEGVLTLKGKVDSEEQRFLVLDIARRIQGVKKVVNQISIPESEVPSHEPVFVDDERQAEGVSDAESQTIADAVIARLQEQKDAGALQDFGIDVRVDQGVVWMTGHVTDELQRTLALEQARYVPGVTQVVNDLTVSSNETAEESTTGSSVILANEPGPVNALRQGNSLASHPIDSPSEPGQVAAQPSAQPIQPSQANGQQGRLVGWALVNVGGNQPQPQPQIPQQQIQPANTQMPLAFAPARPVNHLQVSPSGQPVPIMGPQGYGVAPARFDHPQLPGYAWPSYAAYPNYGAVTYPKQYSAQAWPYIGPFYPYPQVPLGWRKVTLEWDDGWWQLDFKDRH